MSHSRAAAKALTPVLTALAASVLVSGVSSAEFARIARHAFVKAAAEHSRFKSGKVNQSLVAAMTGLPRAEIRRILSGSSPHSASRSLAIYGGPRRVLSAWHQDPAFADQRGRPRALPLRGGKVSFHSLSRKYCRDVSPSTVLKELRRVDFVRVQGSRVSIRAKPLRSLATLQRLERLNPLLTELCRSISEVEGSLPKPQVDMVYLPARSAVEATLVRNHATATLAATIDGLRAISPISAARRNSRRLLVATILAEPPLTVSNATFETSDRRRRTQQRGGPRRARSRRLRFASV